jgi:predicted membrane-bound spermidine synthase
MAAFQLTKTMLLVVFLLSFCGLGTEIALTRVFAVVLRYHFAFLAIAIALCGLGLGGYIAHWLRERANGLSFG